MLMVFDYDNISEWGPRLGAPLGEHLPKDISAIMVRRAPEYVSDAFDELSRHATLDRLGLAEIVTCWIKGQSIAAYHGSRLTSEEIADIQELGLRRLVARDRGARLASVLSKHPEWGKANSDLPSVLDQFGMDDVKSGHGLREGQVHATLSRSGLADGFNHYLTHGSEFDQNVADMLLGESGRDLLASHGRPVIFTLNVPGELAFAAANQYWLHLPQGDLPNIVRETLYAFSFWLARSDFKTTSLETDCGLVFEREVPAEWIVAVTPWK
jgi:hypothetical protein